MRIKNDLNENNFIVSKLKKYQEKRNFEKTAEPVGNVDINKKKDGLTFAVQHHFSRREHYDLRLEWGGVLLSWAVPKGASFNPKDKRLAVKVEDHPLDYADFEGIIPKGEYGGGTVLLWDYGIWQSLTDAESGLKEGSLKFKLFGKRLKGGWTLIKLKSKENENDDNWLLIKEKDEYAQSEDGISHFNTSLSSGRTIVQINRGEKILTNIKNPFSHVDIQLAVLADEIPKGMDYIFEVKHDGYRILAFIENNKVLLQTRNKSDYSNKFQNISSALKSFADGRAMVLDGEVIVADKEGRSDFQALQNLSKTSEKNKPLTYVVFDLLSLDGQDLRNCPLSSRKEKLKQLLLGAPPEIVYSEHVVGQGEKSFKAAEKYGLEGIIGKKVDSIYSGTRNDDWIKIKCYKRQEFVIGGYTLTENKSNGFSALLLGVYEKEKLIYVGRVGTGFTEKNIGDLMNIFKPLIANNPTFSHIPKTKEKIFWLKPKLVAEVQFAEWTKENHLRQASFKGIREDKEAGDVVREIALSMDIEEKQQQTKQQQKQNANKSILGNKLTIKGVEISSPDKVIYKDKNITKLGVVNYYSLVSDTMMKYVKNRIMSVVCCNKGVDGVCFYKKHPIKKSYGVVPFPVTNSAGKTDEYFYLNSDVGLITHAQRGTIEFHIWGSKVENLDMPDMMVFDLDPDENISLRQIRQGVKDLKKVLNKLGLKSFLKTSGGKGYHIVVPFQTSSSWDVFSNFAKQIAIIMESKWPELYTCNMRKVKRKGKIFIDWARNTRGATSVAPYSLRARKGAAVSMPIFWNELDKIAPNGIDMNEALKRLRKADPWRGFFKTNQKLK